MSRNPAILILAFLAAIGAMRPAIADPLPGRDILKFQQRPMAGTFVPNPGGPEIFNGHDELSTAYSVLNTAGQLIGYQGQFMADDFADRFSSPVVHVKWWGSYLNQQTAPVPGVRRFLISFETDVPASPTNPFSYPGEPLLNQIVTLDPDGILTPGSGTFTERVYHPVSVDGPIYEYNAELHLGKEFHQEPDTVYWLKIVALVDPIPGVPPDLQTRWGWHNRDYTIMDPFASVAPDVVPGEHNDFPGGPFPVWHFQDNAVDGSVFVGIDPLDPMTQIMPFVQQDVRGPNNYHPIWDGPSLIGQFSKDLAFELYTVPEPATIALLGLAIIAAAFRLRNGRA
jgi:hypothetical protein